MRYMLILSLVPLSQCSLMSRIGLRLGAAHVHHQSALDHKPRQPWAVRNMKAEMIANERTTNKEKSNDKLVLSHKNFWDDHKFLIFPLGCRVQTRIHSIDRRVSISLASLKYQLFSSLLELGS